MEKLNLKKLVTAFGIAVMFCLTYYPVSAQKPGEGKMKQHKKEKMEKMKTELNLTADQVSKIEAINQEMWARKKAVKEKHAGAKDVMKAEMKTIRQEHKARIDEVLTNDQRAKWEQVRAEMKKEHKSKHGHKEKKK